jgi:hypothetical protein
MMLVLLALTRYFQALQQLVDRLMDIRAFPVALALAVLLLVVFLLLEALVLLVKVLTEEMVLLMDKLAAEAAEQVAQVLLVYQAHLVEMAVLECVQPLLDSVLFILAVAAEMFTALEPQD